MADLRPSLAAAFHSFGVVCTVTPTGGVAIAATGIYEPPGATAIEGVSQVNAQQPRWSFRRSEVPTLPIGTSIVGPDAPGAAAKTFQVIRTDDASDPELFVALVREVA